MESFLAIALPGYTKRRPRSKAAAVGDAVPPVQPSSGGTIASSWVPR